MPSEQSPGDPREKLQARWTWVGKKPAAFFLAVLGLLTTTVSSILACIPPAEEPHKFFAVVKLLGSSVLMVAVGAVVYWLGKSKHLEL